MQCDSASMPVAAVKCGGSPSVSPGSMRATLGMQFAPPTLFFCMLLRSVSTAQGVTSAPVPAVVGMPIIGGMSRTRGMGRALSRSIRAYSATLASGGPPSCSRAALAPSMGLPPPRPMSRSAPAARKAAAAASTESMSGLGGQWV